MGMSALRACSKKTKMTTLTTIISSMSVCLSVATDSSMSCDRSYVGTSSTPLGRLGSISRRRSLTASMTVSAFSP